MNSEDDFGGFSREDKAGVAAGLSVGIIGAQGRMGSWLRRLLVSFPTHFMTHVSCPNF